MPSAAVMLNVVGAAPGYWILRNFVHVGGKLASDRTEHQPYCSAALYELTVAGGTGAQVKPETKVNTTGYVTWDGTLGGTWTDLLKRGLRMFSYYKRGDLVKEVYTDIGLGYAKHDHSNPTVWEKWINLVYKNLDAGLNWYQGIPYTWWYGQSADWFAKYLEDHIEKADEPLWKTTAPALNIMAGAQPRAISIAPNAMRVLPVVGSLALGLGIIFLATKK